MNNKSQKLGKHSSYMESIHERIREDKNNRKEIINMRKKIYNDYICDLNDGNLNIHDEKSFIKSLIDKSNKIITISIGSILGVIIGIFLNPIFSVFSTNDHILTILFIDLPFIIALLFFVCIIYYLLFVKDIFKIYESLLKKNIYYSICLDVLDDLERSRMKRLKS